MEFLHTVRRLLELLPGSDGSSEVRIIDGGCHVGKFTKAAVKFFPDASVLSFEPDPETWKKAKHNFESFHGIEVVNAALGSENGRREFFRGPVTGTNSLLPRFAGSAKTYYPKPAVLEGGTFVDVVAVDDECARRGIDSIDILKLDLQGGELAALEGARRLLGSDLIKVVIVEAVFVTKYEGQPLFWEIWRLLESLRYSVYSLEDVIVGPYRDNEPSLRQGQWNQCNAIFISAPIRAALEK